MMDKELEYECELLLDDGESLYVFIYAGTCQDLIGLVKTEAEERQLRLAEIVSITQVG